MRTDLTKFELINLVITKEEIDCFDHVKQLELLNEIKKQPFDFNSKLMLIVYGYDNDPRELWEIVEIRNYFNFLDRCFPYWFYFLNRQIPSNLNSLGLIAMLVVDIEVIKQTNKQKTIQLNMDQLNEFLKLHFYYLDQFSEEIGLSIEANKKISEEIIKVYFPDI